VQTNKINLLPKDCPNLIEIHREYTVEILKFNDSKSYVTVVYNYQVLFCVWLPGQDWWEYWKIF